jgi:Domain of unknown function (DUF4282)
MPDRSPHQDLPEDSAADASDGYGAGTTGSHRARSTDEYGTGTADAFGAAGAAGAAAFDALGTRADFYGAAKTDAFGIRPADTYGTGAANPFGDADPFGPRDADPFGPRVGDPFGPPATGAFGAKAAAFAAVTADPGTVRPDPERPVTAIGDQAPGEVADPRGFLGALFDFGFTSFVTPKIIRVLFMLIVVGAVLSALVFTIIAFQASMLFGILTLVFGAPLFILIVLAIYRVLLEFFVITFRMAEDVRAMRERDGG